MPPDFSAPSSRRALLRGAALVAGTAATSGLIGGQAPNRASAAPLLVRGDRPVLPLGVQSGDVRPGSAVLWSRADRPARLVAEISRDPSFRKVRTVRGPVVTPETDFTGQLVLDDLPEGTETTSRASPAPPRRPRWPRGSA